MFGLKENMRMEIYFSSLQIIFPKNTREWEKIEIMLHKVSFISNQSHRRKQKKNWIIKEPNWAQPNFRESSTLGWIGPTQP